MVKRKKKDSEDGGNEEEKEDTGNVASRAFLKGFATEEGVKERTKTITTSFERVVNDEGDFDPEELRLHITAASNSLGILRHLVTVFLNVKALSDPECDYLFSQTAYQQLFARLGGVEGTSSELKMSCMRSRIRCNL